MKISTSLDFFKQFPLFNVLSDEEMAQLLELVELKKVKKYDHIYKIGDASEYVCFLVKGIVKNRNNANAKCKLKS